ncbi:MAG: hypothetical protein WDZ62_01765 [Candidatus Pacearchaeota archaeon]
MEKRVAGFRRMLLKTFIFAFIILITFSFVQAQENETEDPIDKAYSCLIDKVDEKCSALSTEEKAFSLLAVNHCEDELIEDSSNEECWPSGNCNLKTTSISVLSLDHVGTNTDSYEEWLLSQTRNAPELTWFIQIESSEATECSIQYAGSYSIILNEDKTISGNPGPGLSIDEEGYWLKVDSNYYETDFEISCGNDFLTNLLFKETFSSTVHVFPTSSSASAGGITTERVESLCFEEGGACNYEGSLWAAFVLDKLGEDVSSYLPYLITLSEDNGRLLPEAFLYSITSDESYRDSLLSKQLGDQRWEVSGDRYYDTALALYPFQSETLQEKTNSQEWLLNVQEADGCWDSGNVKNTAFILESLWPKDFKSGTGNGGQTPVSCEDSGNYCVPSGQCGGDILDLTCSGSFSSVCCSVQVQQETCFDKGGSICSSGQICSGGNFVSAEDTSRCCVEGGVCEDSQGPEVSECEQQGGICRPGSGRTGEVPAEYSCTFSGDTCYVLSTDDPKNERNFTWIWILLILIVLVTLGIIFRDKLRNFWLKVKSKFGGSKGKSSGEGSHRRPPGYGPYSGPRPSPGRRPVLRRRIIPRTHPTNNPKKDERKSGANKELDEVLKKLKEMGN